MKKVFYIISVSVLLCGCEDFFKREVEAPDRANKPQLVVHSYISPENPEIKVSVSMSKPTFGTQISRTEIVSDAKVVLYNDQNENIEIPYNNTNEYYVIPATDFPIVAGKTYRLEVKDTHGNHATATCSVPHNILGNIQNAKVLNVRSDGLDAYQISFDFQDTANIRNYYLATTRIETDNGVYPNIKIKPFTDNNRDGGIISVRSEKEFGKIEQVKKIEITLHTADVNYYEYVRTYQMQLDNENLGPFSEPIFIISNIKGGLGVFGAYSETKATINF